MDEENYEDKIEDGYEKFLGYNGLENPYADYEELHNLLMYFWSEYNPEDKKKIENQLINGLQVAMEKVTEYEKNHKKEEQTQKPVQEVAEEEQQTQEEVVEQTQGQAKKKEAKDKKIVELLSELADKQDKLTTLRVQRAKNGVKESIDGRISTMRTYLEEQAKRYRANSETVESILKNYEEKLANLKEAHEKIIKADVNEKDKQEVEEIRIIGNLNDTRNERDDYMRSPEYSQYKKSYATLKREASKLMENGDIEGAQDKLVELKKMQTTSKVAEFDKKIKELEEKLKTTRDKIAECKSRIDGAKKFYESKIDDATQTKNEDLQKVEKQGVFAKLFGAIYDKIGGKDKFEKRVVGPVKKQIEDIGKTISSVAGSVKNGVTSTFSSIRTKAREAKSSVICGIKSRIQASIDKTQTKINSYEKNNEEQNNIQEEYQGEEI